MNTDRRGCTYRAMIPIGLIVRAVEDWLRMRGNEKWPLVNATISLSTLEPVGSNSWTITIVYLYSVGGPRLWGKISRSYTNHGHAEMFHSIYPQGKSISV